MKKHKSAWLIIAQTNLHVGSEGMSNFGIIDKAIQRDATTNLPCVHSSSLKGAIKEYIVNHKDLNVSCKDVFGSDKDSKDDIKKGNTIFFDANLLFLPIQCTTADNCLFKLAYDPTVLEAFEKRLDVLEINYSSGTIINKISDIYNATVLKEVSNFQDICTSENLPIIARNKLENGESDNLWYEEVLPSQSILGTVICTDDDKLEEALAGKLIQIGANATVGYGYCSFIKLT